MSKPVHLTRNDEAEAAVVGAIMLRNDAIDDVRCAVEPDDFYSASLRATYSAMLGLAKDGHPIDLVTLERQLRATDELGLVGGIEGIGKLADRHPSSHNVMHHVGLIRDASRRRRIVAEAEEAIAAARGDSDANAGEIAEQCANRFGRLAEGRGRIYTGGELATMAIDQGVARMRGEVSSEPLSTGLTKLDEAIGGGLEPATVIFICARPGNGKTALTTCMQLTIGRASGSIFGLQMDMGGVQTGRRLIAVAAPLHLKSIKHPKKPTTVDAMMAARDEIAAMSLTFDTRKQTAREARAQIREWRRKHRKHRGCVFVDYLQQHRSETKGHDRHDLELAEWVGEYKGLAEELEVPVVICSQLNRKVEERDDKRPRMSDVRDSGQIEEYADVMLGLYREARYNPEADKLAAEILVLKHRDEPTGTVNVHFEPWYTRFIDAPEGEENSNAEQQQQQQRRTYRNPRKYAANPD